MQRIILLLWLIALLCWPGFAAATPPCSIDFDYLPEAEVIAQGRVIAVRDYAIVEIDHYWRKAAPKYVEVELGPPGEADLFRSWKSKPAVFALKWTGKRYGRVWCIGLQPPDASWVQHLGPELAPTNARLHPYLLWVSVRDYVWLPPALAAAATFFVWWKKAYTRGR
ncbi:MAG TPA: hypothetical protein VD969_18785 [Symbiobacteriaceae bacterium]|nr:hypothetical protein [Symbiobacteriaceae bacterium]